MNKYEHIIIPETIKKAIKYSPRGSGGGGLSIPCLLYTSDAADE